MRSRFGVIAAVAVVASGAGAMAVPALTGAQSDGPREITLRMKARGGAHVQHSKTTRGDKLAPGDVLVVRLAMFSPRGEALGSAYTECVNVGRKARAFDATLQCVQTYKFKDGQIVTAGLATFSQLKKLSIPIVGGSGAYRGASGQLTSGDPVKGYASVDVLHLD